MKANRIRYITLFLIVILVFGAVYFRLYDLQVTSYDSYTAEAESKKTKTLTLTGKRGTIYDANMIPLAYDKLTYNVQFYRDPSASSEEDRRAYTQAIVNVIKLIEGNGKKTIDGFWLELDEENKWRFNTGTENAAVAARREEQWRSNFIETSTPVDQLFDSLCTKYFVPEELSTEEKIKVLAIWQESRMYNYLSRPVTIAYGVDFETVCEIEVRSTELLGVSIAESSERVYPKGSLASHTIGYISRISGEETLQTYLDKGYSYDSLVGMTGIEASMEDQLTANAAYRQGRRTVEINNRGKIIRELSYEAPIDGNDVILTIDTQLQLIAEESLAKNIAAINKEQQKLVQGTDWIKRNRDDLLEYEEAGKELQFAETGAVVAMDPNTGRILAMASYPDFDLSYFSGTSIDSIYWNELVDDDRNPMFNRGISARDTPGSIFKMVTALGGLMEGAISVDTVINDEGPYTKTDKSYHPSCWISRYERHKHQQNQTLSDAIKNSCNYFFYETGNLMGSEAITKWGAALGLTSRTGIELPNEATSFIGNQTMLYDPSRAISDQYTFKPEYSAYMIKQAFLRIGEERNIKYDDDRLDRATKKILDISQAEGTKDEVWPPAIRDVLINDMSIPSDYISKNFLVNEFFYYINDLRWTPNETIMAAIGQSITQVTPVAVARYVSAIANGGTVYDAQIIDKIVSPSGSVVLEKEPVVVNKIEGEFTELFINTIKRGMEQVTSTQNEGTAGSAFKEFEPLKIAGKTGTSQRTNIDVENNSWLVTYAPYDDPQIVVVVYIQNGYAGLRSANTAISIIEYYLNHQETTERTTAASPNSLGD